MLELKNIRKVYSSGGEKVEALKGINLKFRESEFVSILGQSGCGKTTLLNIIGGLDRYTTGDLVINGKSTKKFKDRDWDAYRNYKIGFIFQSYNLIGHQSILSNVELALTIGGISKKDRKMRAIQALQEVGLGAHMHKRPNQLSGGQMQRVAIARALVNNPDIILADEPTGALDTKTSIQVMEILKQISKNKLIIMVTHNPELAEQYSSRIIKILDGVITEDSDPVGDVVENVKIDKQKMKKTSMSFFTAFRLSLNNLLTKKGRTLLVSFAGSIGIIGIAMVLAISNGFQAYVDHIQEEALTSYPLTIMQESTDLASILLSMTNSEEEQEEVDGVKEEQYISKVLDSLSTNDLRSFKKHLENNYSDVENDISSVSYSYSVQPQIYGIDTTQKIVKLNPNNVFSSLSGGGGMAAGMMGTSTYSQMIDDEVTLNESYDVLAGKWPKNYDEMVIVLSEKNSISDFLLYSLGFKDSNELTEIVKSIMSGETVELKNEPMVLSYQDLMNKELKLVLPTETYKYNDSYEIYEDMADDEDFMKNVYNSSVNLKIVGVVAPKEGTSSNALQPGVAYTNKLITYIIDQSKDKEMVKKQLENQDVDVISGARFDEKKNASGFNFEDLISIDTSKLQSAFDIKIDQNDLQKQTEGYMVEINNALSTDTGPAKQDFMNNLQTFTKGVFSKVPDNFTEDDIDRIVDDYLNEGEPQNQMADMEKKYVIPKDVFKATYTGLLKALLNSYYAASTALKQNQVENNNLEKAPVSEPTSVPSTEDIKGVVESIENTIPDEIKDKIPTENFPTGAQGILENAVPTNMQIPENMELPTNIQIPQELADKIPEGVNPSDIVISENMESFLKENFENSDLAKNNEELKNSIISGLVLSIEIEKTADTLAKAMTEAVMKKTVLMKVAELTGNLTSSFASAFNVDQEKIASAFQMKMTEDEISRIISSMMTKTESNAKINLINFGYQDKEEPTYISFYFKSFDGKENFKDFIKEYNDKVKSKGEDDKEIKYTDTTGILMGSVKTIVNAVTYVLIAFISISLVVSSIMIGIITYISVYERTKEIGILRAIGASKRNISSIFNAETFIIGLLSGLIGIGFTYGAIPVINNILHQFTGNIPLNATFYASNAIILVILSVILTLIGGLIPAKSASKRDQVVALRTE